MAETTNEKVIIQNGNDIVELTGKEKESFLADRKIQHDALLAILESDESKKAARESALAKLAALGLTEEEIAAL